MSQWDEDDLDSSEDEFKDTVADFENAGKNSIQAMLETPFSLAESDKFLADLTPGGSWRDRYCLFLWSNRLTAFRTRLLGRPKESVPGVDDIIRFLVHFARGRHGRGKDGVLHYDTMKSGIHYIEKWITFEHADFKLGAHGHTKLEAAMYSLVQAGDLTRAIMQPREPAGAIVVRRLVICLLQDAITKGTSSWDSTLNDIAMLVLTSCFNTRGGDLMGDSVTAHDKRADLPGLRYSDVRINVGAGGTLSDLQCRVKIRSAKGMKSDESQFFHLFRKSLNSKSDNIMCAVKVILVLALRSGNTHGRSIEDVLEHTTARSDRIVQWRFPNRPVLCGASSSSTVLDWEMLAPRHRASRALERASFLLGSDARISLHQLRHGAADDLQAIRPHDSSGLTPDAVSAQLGHHPRSRMNGVGLVYTKAYSTDDYWSQRSMLEPKQLPFNDLVRTTDPSLRAEEKHGLSSFKRQRSQADVTRDCEDRGLDPRISAHRHYRSRRGRSALSSMLEPSTSEGETFGVESQGGTGSPDAIVSKLQGAWDASQPAQSVDDSRSSTEASQLALSLTELEECGAQPDETAAEAIEALLGGDKAFKAPDTIAIWDQSLRDALAGGSMEFVRRFSSVNVLRIESIRSKRWQAAVRAGDDATNCVNKATRFQFRCLNRNNGCRYDSAFTFDVLVTHAATCTYDETLLGSGKHARDPIDDDDSEPEPVPKRGAKEKRFKCPEIGCSKAYGILGDLTFHVNDHHKPVQCFVHGCKDSTEYIGDQKLLRHIVAAHPAKGRVHPTVCDQTDATFECPFEDCTSEFRFYASRTWAAPPFIKHCSKEHGMSDKQAIERLIPGFPGNPCFFPKCDSTERFEATSEGEKKYLRHLKHDHHVADASERFEYLWKRVRGVVMPMKPDADVGEV